MKKIICLLFLFIFSLVFISCDENNPVIDDPVIDDIYYEVKFVIDTKEEVIKVKENTKVTKPDDPEKDGYEFIGWFNDDTLYDFKSLVTKDIIIIAKFNELKPMLEINVLDNKLNMGYSTQINAKFYDTEAVSLEYKVDQKGIVYIDDKGHKATALITYKMSFYEDTINYSKPLKKGEKIYVYTTFEEGKIIGTEVAYRDNTNNLIIILILFILTVILIGGVKGIKSLVGLIVTIALIFYVLVPRNNGRKKSITINIYSFCYNSNSIIYNNIRI